MWSCRLWITFRVSLHMIWGYLGPVSPDDHNAQIHVKQVNGNLQLTLTEGHSLIWCEMWSWKVLITLRVSLHMILGHLAPVSQICPNPRLPQNRYNSTLKLLDKEVRLHLSGRSRITFCVHEHLNWGIWAQFLQIVLILNTR